MFQEIDEFDLAEALYLWLQHNWEGQGDELYSDFCKLTAPGMFNPSRGLNDESDLEDAGAWVYGELTRNNYKDALNRVLNYKSEG